MNDLLYIAIFLGCGITTLGLLELCERLTPAPSAPHAASAPRTGSES